MRYLLAALVAAVLGPLPLVGQTLSKGHRILLDHGLQVQGMVNKDDPFHLDTYQNAGFTAAYWMWDSHNTLLGSPPGLAWARWVRNESEMPFSAEESPYAGSLIALQLGDEQNLNDPLVRANTAQWFDHVRAGFPNVLLYCNNYGGQVTNANLDDFIRTARPDMLSFDTYPFTPSGPVGGSPTNLYGDMQRYRRFALGYGLPYALYTQTFHDAVTRDASESELRLHYLAGAAFGYTCFAAFTYNTGASSLFQGPGDTNPRPACSQLAEIHRRLQRLGPALTRLVSTDVRFINGQHRDSATGETVNNATPIDILNWQFGVNDPYLRGWVVTNLGNKNDGLRGDVLLSWFKVLDESFDGSGCSGETYFMVTNGLTAPEGSAADCAQQIKLNFLFSSSAITSLQHLRQDTGQVEVIELPILPNTGGRRQLTLSFDGGTAELFKFNTGAPFVGVPDADPPGAVQSFSTIRYPERLKLAWTNPGDCDLAGTLIRRKIGSSPTSATDGTWVADRPGIAGSADSVIDAGLSGGTTYFYAAFAHDPGTNYAPAATATGTPARRGDYDLDGDADLDDFGIFQRCLSGTNIPCPPGCEAADIDRDGDADASDLDLLIASLQGPNLPP